MIVIVEVWECGKPGRVFHISMPYLAISTDRNLSALVARYSFYNYRAD
jgi:hypothetical protein